MNAEVPKGLRDVFKDKEFMENLVPYEETRMFSALLDGATKIEVKPLQPGDIISKDNKRYKVRRVDWEGEPVLEELEGDKNVL